MLTLLQKIEADAARRLPLPPGGKPSQELSRYKNFLKVETHRLKMLHRAGAGGREICHARAAVLDVLQRYVLEAVRHNLSPDSKSSPLRLALVAIGGYGRGELSPFSDIDIMLLHDGDSVMVAFGLPPSRRIGVIKENLENAVKAGRVEPYLEPDEYVAFLRENPALME